MKRRGIVTFRDKEKLEIGKSISSNLIKVIEESRFAIVILSKYYASSTRCFDELTKIIGYMKDIGTTVLQIFHDVDPSNVWKQLRPFALAFCKTRRMFQGLHREGANMENFHERGCQSQRVAFTG